MSEQLRESLSAAMDDEADAFELRRVLDEAKHNEGLREQWHRFHLIRDLLREDVKTYSPTLRDAIWEELNQPVDDTENVAELVLAEEIVGGKPKRSPWLGRLTGTAVAAGVAALVIFNGPVFDDGFDADQGPVNYAGNEQSVPRPDLVPVMYQQATARDQQRQNGFILHHHQQIAINQAGVASFVKVAVFKSGEQPMSVGDKPDIPPAEVTPTP
jgi:sigma-E factor negative regulatory protein RseA